MMMEEDLIKVKEIDIAKNKFMIHGIKIGKKYADFILFYANKHKVDKEILFAFLCVESLNRNNLINNSLEKVGSLLFPNLLVKLDLSLGLGQVKISTAKKLLHMSEKNIVKRLLNTESNISMVALLLKNYIIICKNQPQARYLVNLYTTGKMHVPINRTLYLYIKLIEWSVNSQLFNKLLSNMYKNNKKQW
ncbi:transglycosylase SLT domain-containing protein [Priestia filamentosa]|uniref:transglycosylase SLT domain-containing protein n=1 Tax=Priestia filamentosa TaxID=1402861 RepID=UPI003981F994